MVTPDAAAPSSPYGAVALFHLAATAFVRLDPFAEKILPASELARLQENFQSRVHASARAAHARALHPDVAGVKGKVSLMRVTKGSEGEHRWETRVVSVSELATSDALLWASHISMQRFYGARGSTSLVQLQALIADVDCHDQVEFRGLSPEAMAGNMIQRLRDAEKPLPSYIIFSGRGLHLIWLHQPLQATPGVTGRHRAVQRWMLGPKSGKPSTTVRTKSGTRLQDPEVIAFEETMAMVWRGTGVDRGAVDAARVLRLAGSYNGKSGEIARLVWPASWADVEPHDFEDLARAFLPFTRDQMACLRAERQAGYELREARRQARRTKAEATGIAFDEKKPTRRISGRYWRNIVEALDAVRVLWGGMPPEGKRDLWAFLSACALAQTEGGNAASWAARLATPAGLPEAELRTSFGALDRMLRRHESGETRSYGGVERPTMYVFSKSRMLGLLGLSDVSEEDLRATGAGALLPGGLVRSEKERSAVRRAESGATPRTDTVAARLADGREALALRAAGKTMSEVKRAFLGRRGETSLRRAMAEATEVPVEAVLDAFVVAPVETASEILEAQSLAVHHDSTSTIVAVPGAVPPSVAPASILVEPTVQTRPVVVPGRLLVYKGQGGPWASLSPKASTDCGAPLGELPVASPGPASASSIPPVLLPKKPEVPVYRSDVDAMIFDPRTAFRVARPSISALRMTCAEAPTCRRGGMQRDVSGLRDAICQDQLNGVRGLLGDQALIPTAYLSALACYAPPLPGPLIGVSVQAVLQGEDLPSPACLVGHVAIRAAFPTESSSS